MRLIATSRRGNAPTRPKLRDSCNSCAASKLKCSKEKPVCARCAKRGMVCEYFAAKRAGRKGSQSSHPIPPSVAKDVPTTTFSEMVSPALPTLDYPDLFSASSSLADPTISTPTTLNFHFDDSPVSPISFSMLDMPDAGHLTESCQFIDHNNSNFIDLDSGTPLPTLSNGSSVDIPPCPESQSSSTPLEEHPVCNFLERALRLLKQLPSPASPSYPAQSHRGLGQFPSIQSVIADNERTVQTIIDMIEFQSSDDGHLLTIISIVIFKVLNWYTAVVRQTAGLDIDGFDHQTQKQPEQIQRLPVVFVDSDGAGDEDEGRIAAQQILSQLHRVQRLVNILSQRFKTHQESRSPSVDGSGIFTNSDNLFPLPGSMLEQIETDLRKRLRNLSAEIVDILR